MSMFSGESKCLNRVDVERVALQTKKQYEIHAIGV